MCEGEATEPGYFRALKDHFRLSTLVVRGTGGVDPRTLVNMASEDVKREKRNGEQFDSVYCVFDRDTHPQFEEASNMALARGFKLARSWPCFEFWLLLHFRYTRAPYAKSGSASPCDACIRDLRGHLSGYGKGDPSTFDRLESRLPDAIANARRAAEDAAATGARDPSTEVHELVGHLQTL